MLHLANQQLLSLDGILEANDDTSEIAVLH